MYTAAQTVDDFNCLGGLMLDRVGLSIRSGWLDGDGRVYICFAPEDAIARLGCGKDKAVRLFRELDIGSGIGLIERRKQGQGLCQEVHSAAVLRNPGSYPASNADFGKSAANKNLYSQHSICRLGRSFSAILR